MTWPLVNIGDLVDRVSSWNPLKSDSNTPFFYIDLSSIDKDEKELREDSVFEVLPKDAPSRARQLVTVGDVLVATVRPNLNGVALVPNFLDGATASTGYCVLRPKVDLLDSRYLFYWARSQVFIAEMTKKATGANYPAISDRIIKESKIPLPPLMEQKRIVTILDKANSIRSNRKLAIELADEFLRAVFLDMFGDPVTNPKGWKTTSLGAHGEFKNGLNYGREESGNRISCLGVGDFKSFHTIKGTSSLGYIELETLPTKEYLLKNGDLIFVRSNGNRALVGRCITVYPEDEHATFSGFCIRYRLQTNNLQHEYLNYLFRAPSMKELMLKIGQGANIQNINQSILSSLSIPCPPLAAQDKFSELVSSFRKGLFHFEQSYENSETLFRALSEKAFSNRL